MFRITLSKRQTLLVATAIVAIVVPIVTYGALRTVSDSHLQAADDPGSRLEIELITLRPGGCEPAEIVRSKDAFVLFIDDRSGKENSSLALQRLNGERLRAVNVNRKKSGWHDVLDLSPGTYVLQDTDNPQLRCQITILP
jgi:hypothetical protein